MLIAAVLITVGLGFNWLVKEHVSSSEGLKSKAEAIIKARSTFDTVIFLILTGRVLAKEVATPGGESIAGIVTLPLNGQLVKLGEGVSVRIQESNGAISLWHTTSLENKAALERLIQLYAKDRDHDQNPADNLWDWIDEDDLARTNGAEAAYYKGKGLHYVPRNYALQSLDELKLIKGFDESLLDKLDKSLTLLPKTGFNPNTASDDVLMAYLKFDEQAMKTMKEYLADKPVSSDREMLSLTGQSITKDVDAIYFRPSPYMDVTIDVGTPRKVYSIKAGLFIAQKKYAPYSVLSWKEE